MLSAVLHFTILSLSVLFRMASALRLTIPLLYALVVPTLFGGWYYSHQALAEGLWWALLGLSLLSWAASLLRGLGRYRRGKAQKSALLRRLHEAGRSGEVVHIDEFWD